MKIQNKYRFISPSYGFHCNGDAMRQYAVVLGRIIELMFSVEHAEKYISFLLSIEKIDWVAATAITPSPIKMDSSTSMMCQFIGYKLKTHRCIYRVPNRFPVVSCSMIVV